MAGKVLVADDSLKIQRQLTEMLQGAGVDVVSVSNGEHARRKIPEIRPDVILADVFMPVRSGYEVCEFVRNQEDLAHIPVVLLASNLEPYDEKEAARVKADGKLEKPFTNPEETLAAIQEFLKKAATQQAAAPPPPEPAAVEPPAGAPEPFEEPEPEQAVPSSPPVQFESTEAPMSFTDILEEGTGAAEETTEEVSPEAQPTLMGEPPVTTETITGASPADLPPAETIDDTIIGKPAVAEPWEMTGPEPGDPEIPSGGNWDSQWTVDESSSVSDESGGGMSVEEPAGLEETAPAAEPDSVDETIMTTSPPIQTEESPAAEESSAGELEAVEPLSGEFGGNFGRAIAKSAREAVAEVSDGGTEVNQAVVEEVVKQVLEQLSPRLTEAIARELVRPLAENILKDKLKK